MEILNMQMEMSVLVKCWAQKWKFVGTKNFLRSKSSAKTEIAIYKSDWYFWYRYLPVNLSILA